MFVKFGRKSWLRWEVAKAGTAVRIRSRELAMHSRTTETRIRAVVSVATPSENTGRTEGDMVVIT